MDQEKTGHFMVKHRFGFFSGTNGAILWLSSGAGKYRLLLRDERGSCFGCLMVC